MKTTTIQWHVARDNESKLAKFCETYKVRSSTELHTRNDGVNNYFQMTFTFNNGGFITAELLHGTEDKSYSVADHFKVVEYGLGS